jgi:hypothetical protein
MSPTALIVTDGPLGGVGVAVAVAEAVGEEGVVAGGVAVVVARAVTVAGGGGCGEPVASGAPAFEAQAAVPSASAATSARIAARERTVTAPAPS